MITVMAILPQTWEFRLVDHNVQLRRSRLGLGRSGDHLQHDCPETRYAAQAGAARQKKVAAGGPYVTSVPDAAQSVWFWMRAEITLPLWSVERGNLRDISRGAKSPISTTIPSLTCWIILRCQCSFLGCRSNASSRHRWAPQNARANAG